MKRKKKNDKRKALKKSGVLNSHPERVKDPLFSENEFFDPKDLIQVKYEMLRKTEKEHRTVAESARNFGFSRLSFYRIRSSFTKDGLAGLIPQRRGPKEAHKLTKKIMDFIEDAMEKDKTLRARALSRLVEKQFNEPIHPRSIERALNRKKKK